MDLTSDIEISRDSLSLSVTGDEGYEDNFLNNLENEDKDLPRLIDYLDDPWESAGWFDYQDLLNISNPGEQDAFEKWLKAQSEKEYPPAFNLFDDTNTFDEFDSSFASSSLDF